jgi:hypothetical protein
MSWIGKLRGGLDMASTAVSALELIGQLARGKIGTKHSRLEILDLIAKIVDRIQAGVTGASKPEDVRAEIDKIRADLGGNNATVDAEADEKFGSGDKG